MNSSLFTTLIEKPANAVLELINTGVNINSKDEYGDTPLLKAIEAENVHISKLLVDAGADANVRAADFYKSTLIHLSTSKLNVELVKLLINAGGDVNAKSGPKWYTPLHLAIVKNKGITPKLQKNKLNICKLLVDAGADINIKDSYGMIPLYLALREKNVGVSKMLINAGACVNKDCENFPLLELAVQSGNAEIVKMLIDAGVSVNPKVNFFGYTSLQLAAKLKNIDLMKLLINEGANANVNVIWYLLKNVINLKKSIKIQKCISLVIEYINVNLIDNNRNEVAYILQKLRGTMAGGLVTEIFLKHFAKMIALELPLDSRLQEITSDPVNDDFLKKCTEELKKAKNTKLRNCWITFFELLVESEYKLAKYAGNHDLVKDFKRKVRQFPIYEDSMRVLISEGKKNRKSLDGAADILSCHLPIFNPTHLIIRNILDELTTSNWSRLCVEKKM